MQNSQVPPTAIDKSVTPSIIAAKQINYTNFEETKKVATFKVKVPKKIPQGYHLTQLQHMRPDLPNIPETVHNDTVSAIYSNGQNQFTIIQGYFSGGDVPKGPQGSMEGTADVSGVKAKWVEGSWAIVKEPTLGDPSSQKEWRTEPLRLGWYKDNLGYSILTDGLKLRDLVDIANSLE
ncbi:hypothetical protein CEB3_c27660 [Peptococcaceae bacterium CEB3]|nr:hypothetical protein CEB3_c27660 [Peptococcaceae bacterium CEB3]